MSELHVSLFGSFCVRYIDQPLNSFEAGKAQELFCYLLLHRDRPVARESLAEVLWGETGAGQPRKYLRKALWQLHAALESPGQPRGRPLLLVKPDSVYLDSRADLWLDVALFEQSFACIEGTPGRELDAERAQMLRHALQLYQGDLLEGWYQDWCLYERERLQHMHLAILDRLMSYCEAREEYEIGLVYGARLLHHDRTRERTYRQMMRLFYLAGDRPAALRQYERCVAALAEELGVRPARRTVALYEQIRADQLDGASSRPAAPREPALGPTPEVLAQLRQLQRALVDAQRRVQQAIESVEAALSGRSNHQAHGD